MAASAGTGTTNSSGVATISYLIASAHSVGTPFGCGLLCRRSTPMPPDHRSRNADGDQWRYGHRGMPLSAARREQRVSLTATLTSTTNDAALSSATLTFHGRRRNGRHSGPPTAAAQPRSDLHHSRHGKPAGSHSPFSASFAGDSSYNASTAPQELSPSPAGPAASRSVSHSRYSPNPGFSSGMAVKARRRSPALRRRAARPSSSPIME